MFMLEEYAQEICTQQTYHHFSIVSHESWIKALYHIVRSQSAQTSSCGAFCDQSWLLLLWHHRNMEVPTSELTKED